MNKLSEEIRYVMPFYFKKGENAAKTLREVNGENAVRERRSDLLDPVLEIWTPKVHTLVNQGRRSFCTAMESAIRGRLTIGFLETCLDG